MSDARTTLPAMVFDAPPPWAAWRHIGVRTGFEVVQVQAHAESGHVLTGCTTAVEDGIAWVVDYRVRVDPAWVTTAAVVRSRSVAGRRSVRLARDDGGWRIDGAPAAELADCLDVDLEASAVTNTFPLHRLDLPAGTAVAAPAAFVRAPGLTVERLEQYYGRTRGRDVPDTRRVDYAAPAFDVACRIRVDRRGFVLDYPGLAVRAA